MTTLAAALLVFQSTAAPLPTGQIVLATSSVRTGDAIPALLVLSAPDTVQALAVSGSLAALPAGLLWWRGAAEGCGRPPRDARAVLEWNSTVRGDEPLALCVRAGRTGALRLAATVRALQPDGTWRTRSLVSDAATASEPFISSDLLLALVTAVLGFLFGVAANLIQLGRQQKGEREKRRMEMEEERAAGRMEMEKKVFGSLTAEVQKNADALRAYIAAPPQQGEKPLQLTLAGMQAVLADPALAAYLRDGEGHAYGDRMRGVYEVLGRFNRAARAEPDPVRRRGLAEEARERIEAALQP
ncbi:hypothetical protein [Longimicrobium sp.]|uniref:hypothetical protein n=1 Tax=Longimicrobium sp. TaxID=2029185 RepID=UPI002B97771A|nr:hypothetical protein [Longimicrobium sp.]HSU16663.1 hypothetical protein [Longimicrobium sp.]